MKKIELSKTTLRTLTAHETEAVAGAAASRGLTFCAVTAERPCGATAGACATLTCAPCSCPGPATWSPPCPA